MEVVGHGVNTSRLSCYRAKFGITSEYFVPRSGQPFVGISCLFLSFTLLPPPPPCSIQDGAVAGCFDVHAYVHSREPEAPARDKSAADEGRWDLVSGQLTE